MTMVEEESERENINVIVENVVNHLEHLVPIRVPSRARVLFPDVVPVGSTYVPAADVKADIIDFVEQIQVVKQNFVVEMIDSGLDPEDPIQRNVDVLIKVPNVRQPAQSYGPFLRSLAAHGMRVKPVDQSIARKTFLRGLAEFFYTRANSPAVITPPVTEVHTNRKGDTVLHALGFFLSTGTAFGTSWPAYVALPSGRYSFGIDDGSGPRFETYTWSIPTKGIVKVKLP
jgi:hypothetical protein